MEELKGNESNRDNTLFNTKVQQLQKILIKSDVPNVEEDKYKWLSNNFVNDRVSMNMTNDSRFLWQIDTKDLDLAKGEPILKILKSGMNLSNENPHQIKNSSVKNSLKKPTNNTISKQQVKGRGFVEEVTSSKSKGLKVEESVKQPMKSKAIVKSVNSIKESTSTAFSAIKNNKDSSKTEDEGKAKTLESVTSNLSNRSLTAQPQTSSNDNQTNFKGVVRKQEPIKFKWDLMFSDTPIDTKSNIFVTFKQYFSVKNRCDICNKFGITLDDLKGINDDSVVKSAMSDGGFVSTCSLCSAVVHLTCCKNYNEKESGFGKKNSNGWLCESCFLLQDSTRDVTAIDLKCELCCKSRSTSKDSHLFLNIGENKWVHELCLNLLEFFRNEKYLHKKLKELEQYESSQMDLEEVGNVTCCVCYNNVNKSIKRLLKCSYDSCGKHYHPICMKEYRLYYEYNKLENFSIISASFCDVHSEKFILKEIDSL